MASYSVFFIFIQKGENRYRKDISLILVAGLQNGHLIIPGIEVPLALTAFLFIHHQEIAP